MITLRTLPVCLFALLFAGGLCAQTRTGRDYAVFFYVTDFQPGISDIPFTKAEAEELAATLSEQYGFSCAYVRECKKNDITAALAEWNKKLKPDDQALFFFSMHGFYDADSDRGYLIPADGKNGDQYNYFSSWLSYDDLRTYLAPCKAGHILVALDACYSGSFGIRSNKKIPGGNAAEEGLDCQTRVRNAMSLKGRQFITAGKISDETPKKSAFVQEILATLRTGYNKEGLVFMDDLAYRLHKLKNPEPEDGAFIGHAAGGDFMFMRKNACAPTPPPDRDGDTVPDADDDCPDTWGSNRNGCPPDEAPDLAAELAAWRKAKAAGTRASYTEYLRQYPHGEFKEPANAALRRIETEELARRDDTAWELATEINTAEAYKKYQLEWPAGRHVTEARDQIKKFELPDHYSKGTTENMTNKIMVPEVPDDGLVLIPGGTFTIGCTGEQQDCGDDEKPVRQVTLSDYYLGKYEVTQKLWRDIMGSDPPELAFKGCDQCPVERVSWEDVQEFLQKLNARYPGRNYRLPTEAEWEYAAREGGKAVLFGNGKNVLNPKEANFDGSASYKKPYSVAGEYRQKTTPVGSFAPNALGLYDMAGNVWEWCDDWYGAYPATAQTNPTGPTSGSGRVIRGGSWYYGPQGCRAANRNLSAPGSRDFNVGFRLARTK
jgi:formylglycine-generating enzyme required for sulfatase activity